jgi:hypothetical protein
MEIRMMSTEPLSLVKGGLALAQAASNSSDFAGIVTRVLDEFDAADFRSAERILEAMRRQGRTVSAYPQRGLATAIASSARFAPPSRRTARRSSTATAMQSR